MAASFRFPGLQVSPLHQSSFLGQTHFANSPLKPSTPSIKLPATFTSPTAKFNLFEILGGRGLCNGEEGLIQELQKTVSQEPTTPETTKTQPAASSIGSVPEDGFEKELLGLTGGFPGGEKGLQKFIEENPPPKKSDAKDTATAGFDQSGLVKKPNPPTLPMLLPGMIAIVKNPSNPFYMYCGIVQRITDGKAGVIFEGGNWDRLVTFRLEELERREKGPPMVNPKSVVLETMVEEKP